MKKLCCLFIVITLTVSFTVRSFASSSNEDDESVFSEVDFDLSAKSAILMEANTGEILYAQNENNRAPLASVTKIMTLLLVMEAITDERVSLNDKIVISGNASSMGGSQVFLEEGESFTLEELVKCTVIASANDAAVALAEHIGGNEKSFVSMMNKRAEELKMDNTNFENVTGLDDTVTSHYSSSYDIALMSRELIKYDLILKYSSLWQDTIRDGAFTLTNTNRLVRYYDGCTGLKTGSTDKAGYCVSATAEREGMTLIAVIMGAPTRDNRNADARALLDYGFANYKVYKNSGGIIGNIPVLKGTSNFVSTYSSDFSCLIKKSDVKRVEIIYDIPKSITAPIQQSGVIGSVSYKIGDIVIGQSDVYVMENIDKFGV